MEKIKVKIEKKEPGWEITPEGNSRRLPGGIYMTTALNGRLSLFGFSKGIGTWNFNAHGIGRAWVKSDEFPLDYFKRLCQAVCFISLGLTEFPEIELTSNAKKLLKIK